MNLVVLVTACHAGDGEGEEVVGGGGRGATLRGAVSVAALSF